jgi:L-alanine-DL-glutamate epimerase-like enolase superfamily enzyme
MKITSIRSQVVRLPVDEPLAGGPPYFRSHNQFVTLRIATEDGIEGIGATFFAAPSAQH